MGDKRWEIGDRKQEMGSRRWEAGDGSGEMGVWVCRVWVCRYGVGRLVEGAVICVMCMALECGCEM